MTDTYEQSERESVRFWEEVGIVRESGGFAPTTDDLRWLNEQKQYALLTHSQDYLYSDYTLDDEIRDTVECIMVHWEHRHDPEIRSGLRASLSDLRKLRIGEGKSKHAR